MSELARSFDRAAVEYERARPGYPAALLDLLPLGPEAEVLDLGAGTGKLTRVLVARYRRVVAVEPLDGMRAILEQVVPGAESLAGSAEAIPVADASVDAVFAAQAFHWFANDEAVAEIARVLRPGGLLALVWNESTDPSPLPEAYRAYLHRLHALGARCLRIGAAHGRRSSREGRSANCTRRAPRTSRCRAETACSDSPSRSSWVAHRPDEERAQIMRELDALLPDGPFAFPMDANVTWAVRA